MTHSYSRFVRVVRLLTAVTLMLSVMPLGAVVAEPGTSDQTTQVAQALVVRDVAQPDRLEVAPAAVPPLAPDAVNLSATKRDAIAHDVDSDGRADPGDTLRYTVVITNSGDTDATNVVFNDTLDDNTVLSGTLKSTPLARNDAYTAVGNVRISLAAGGGVLVNDNDPDGSAISVVSAGTTSTNGGNVAVNADGSFTYNPPPGYEGTDTFTYTIQDADGNQDSATVSVTVSGMIWFINNNAGACISGCDGRLTSPFATLAAFAAVNTGAGNNPAANDNIFVYESATAYANGLTLLNGQRFIGQDSTGSLVALTGVTPSAYSDALPAMNTSAPAVTINGGTNAVTLAQNNALYGFTSGTATGPSISGSNFGTLLVNDVIINTTGAGISLSTGTLGSPATFTSITSSGGSNNVSLTGVSGTANLGGGALSGASSHAFAVDGGTAVLTYNGTINNATARSVSVVNKTGGSVTFTGAVSGTSQGVFLNSNTGATITFAGGLSLNTGANAAFTATGGGTVNVCDENPCNPAATGALVNTLTTTTATALNVNGTTIGANNLEFRSISSTGGSATGIILINTGSTGALVVSGDGANTARGGNGSGGTISNKTGADGDGTVGSGVYINNGSATLRRMNLHTFDNFGLYALSANSVTLQYSTVGAISGAACADADGNIGTSSGSADAAIVFGKTNPSGLNGFNNAGSALLDNLLVYCSIEHQIEIYQQSNTFSATISNSDVKDNSASFGSDGILTEMQGTANGTISVQTVAFDDNKSQAMQGAANDSSVLDLTINQSTVTRSTQGNEGFVLSNGSNGRLIAHVTNNTITSIGGVSIFVGQTAGNANALAGGAVGLTAVIRGNTINTPSSAANHAIIAYLTSTVGQVSLANILIESNTIAQNSTSGLARPFLIDTPDNNTTPSWTATVINNNVTFVDAGTGLTADVTARRGTGCFDVRNNVIAGPWGIRVRQASPATVQLEQGVSGSTVPATVLDDNHPAGTVTSVAGTVTVVGNSTCMTPPVAQLPNNDQAVAQQPVDTDLLVKAEGGSSKPWLSLPFNPAFAPQPDRAVEIDRVAAPIAPFTIGTLPAGKTITLTFEVVINNPVPDGVLQVSNQGTVTADGGMSVVTDDPDTVAANDPTVTALDIQADIQLLGKSDGALTVTPGQQFGYTLTYTNAGPQSAASVTLTETVPANTTYTGSGWTCIPNSNAGSVCTINVGNVAINTGGSSAFTVTVINPVPTGVTQLSNSASIGTSVLDPDPGNNAASDTTPIEAAPDLVLAKTDGAVSATPGGTIAYTLIYTNAGNQDAAGVVLTETVPANTSFNAVASSAGWACAPDNTAGSVCTLTIGALAGGNASGSRTFAVTVANPVAAGVTQISNTASSADDGSNGADPIPANNTASDTTPVDAAPDLTITKTDGGSSTTPGGTVTYTLNYANAGDQAATGVTLSDTIPANTSFNPGASTAGWSCLPDNTAGSLCTLSIGSLAGGGANGSATFVVAVDSPIPAGVTQLTNTASINDDGSNGADTTPADNTAGDTTPVTAAPDLQLTKSDGGARGIPNGTVAYTLAFANTGNQGATGVTLTDTVPVSATFNAGASSAGWSCADGAPSGTACSLVIGSVVGGGNGSRVFAVTTDGLFPLTESAITNTATIADDGTNGADDTPANNTATDSTPIDTVPDLTIAKSHTGNFTKGQVGATYIISVSNVGGLPTSDTVTVTDALPVGLTATGLSGSGWACDLGTLTCTRSDVLNASASYPDITLIVDVAVNAASTVTNTATVSGGGEANPSNNTADDVTTLDKAASTTAVTSSPNPSVFGQTVTFTATVTSAVGTPTGSVTFVDGVTTLGSGTLSGGVATFSTSSLLVGSHTITATYNGDADFNTSVDTATQIVNKADSTTTLTSAPNPSVLGQSITFTATVTASAPGAGTPTGVVTFTEGAVTLGTGTLSGGVATFSTSALSVGLHSVSATYDGDDNFNPSSDAATQTVNKASSSTVLASAPNPAVFGQAVTFTATVTSLAGTPTGVVTFTEGAVTIGTGTLDMNGVATLNTSSLSVGTHAITATYGGDVSFTASTSNQVDQVVEQANTSIALASAANPSAFGQSVTFTASVVANAPGSGTPTGSVTFFDNGISIGSGTLAGGVATLSTASLSVGTHPITATYSGDTNFVGSATSILNQVIDQANTNTTLASALNPSIYGQAVTFTATVSASAPGAGLPTGSVTFFSDGAPLGSSSLSGGVATLATPSLAAGTHAITATYSGDVNFIGSTASNLNQVVNQADTTTALTSAPNPSIFSQAVTLTATVTSSGGTPTGSVTFYDGVASLGTVNLSGGVATLTTTSFTAGSHALIAQSSGDANFTGSTSITITHVVDKATAAVTLGDLNQVYDGTPRPITATTNPIGLVVTFTYDGGSTPPVNAGSYAVVGTISDTNYAGTNSGTLLVAPAPLTVTANNASKVYGDANPAFSVIYAGFQGTDNATSLTVQPTATTTATTMTPVGAYAITSGGGVATNYAFTYLTGTLTISTAPLTVTANDQSRTYGAANPPLTVSYAGFKGSDDATSLSAQPIATTTATVLSPIGAYPITVSGGASNNYTFAYESGTLTITRATLTVTADDQTRFYGEANPTLTASYSGFVNGETSAVLTGSPVLTTSADINSLVGAYPITITTGTLTAANYAFNLVDGMLHVVDTPVTNVTAVNDSPTVIGGSTVFTATGSGTNVQFNWQFGDGSTATGNPVTHTYLAIGVYPVTVTVSNGADSVSANTVATIDRSTVHLPLVMNRFAAAPDLIVQQITAPANSVQVVIKNQGDRPVENEFWVDVYINPTTAPTHVNQTWPTLGTQGLVWGVTADAFPALAPGGVLTLTVNDSYFWPSLSNVTWPLPIGTPVYAQVDSADAATTYGAVEENHEIVGGTYNNIRGPVFVTTTIVNQMPDLPVVRSWPASPFDRWPIRPQAPTDQDKE